MKQRIGTAMILPKGTEIKTLALIGDEKFVIVKVQLEQELIANAEGGMLYEVSPTKPAPLISKDNVISFLGAALILSLLAHIL